MTTAASVLKIAASQIGYIEKPAGSNRTKYGSWYGLDRNPWCAMFVSWVMHQAGYPLAIQTAKGFAWTPAGVQYAKANKRWIDSASLKPGDLIFFNFDNDAGPEHVGFVEKVLGPGSYITIEGNTGHGSDANGGEVQRRARKGAIVLGGLRPSFSASKPPAQKPTPASDGFRHPTLRKGHNAGRPHSEVKHLQALLHRHGAVIVMDGVFGPATEKALRAEQKHQGLLVDGICGPRSWAELHTG